MSAPAVGVEGIKVGSRNIPVETVWSAELPALPSEFSVDVELSSGLTIVVPHTRPHADGTWFVVAKDSGDDEREGRQLIARFTPHNGSHSNVRLLLSAISSPIACEGSSLLVLMLATALGIQPAGARTVGPATRAAGTAPSRSFVDALPSEPILRFALLAALAVALLARIAAHLTERFPQRRGYTLVIQPRFGKVDDLIGTKGEKGGNAGPTITTSLMQGLTGAFKRSICVASLSASGGGANGTSNGAANGAEGPEGPIVGGHAGEIDLYVGPLMDAIERSLEYANVFGPLMVRPSP